MKHLNQEGEYHVKTERTGRRALHSELTSLRKRIEALEARVTELEKEMREAQELAPTD